MEIDLNYAMTHHEAFKPAFWRELQALTTHYCRQFGVYNLPIEDVTVEAWIYFTTHYREDRGLSPVSYWYTAVRKATSMMLKDRETHLSLEECTSLGLQFSEAVEEQFDPIDCQPLLEHLDSRSRMVIVGIYWENLTTRELASRMQISTTLVSKIHKKALQTLKTASTLYK